MMSREAVTRIGSWSINGWDFRLTIWQVSVYTSIERWTYLFLSFCVSCWRRLCAALRLHLLWFCFHFLQRDLQDASESCVFPLPGKDDNPWFTLNHWRISRRGVRMIVRVALQTCIPPVCLCRLILLALVPSNRCSWLLIMGSRSFKSLFLIAHHGWAALRSLVLSHLCQPSPWNMWAKSLRAFKFACL